VPGYTYDPISQRYRDSRGRLVSDATVRGALDLVLAAQTQQVRDLSQQLLDGTITLAMWQLGMLQAIKQAHVVALAVAHGGWSQLDQSDFGWVGSQIKPQYAYLRDFANDIASGAQPMNGVVVARVTLYIAAARVTNREAQRRIAAQRMVGQERRVLGVADHCPTCVQQARLGWQPFGTLRRIGDSECRVNCRCALQFRATPAQAAA
jgi:hypothetical protein